MTKRKRYRLSEPMLRADRPLYMGVTSERYPPRKCSLMAASAASNFWP